MEILKAHFKEQAFNVGNCIDAKVQTYEKVKIGLQFFDIW